MVKAVKKWKPYLLRKPFLIKADQQSLIFLLEQRVGTSAQQKWATKLLGYSFVVEYMKVRENKAIDALSGRMEGDGIAENYFVSGSSIGIIHAQGTKLNQEINQGDYEMLLTRKL